MDFELEWTSGVIGVNRIVFLQNRRGNSVDIWNPDQVITNDVRSAWNLEDSDHIGEHGIGQSPKTKNIHKSKFQTGVFWSSFENESKTLYYIYMYLLFISAYH